jgi:hypothetical protein
LSYNPKTGDFQGAFVSAGSGGLDTPACIDFGFDEASNMFVCSFGSDEILRYSRLDGHFIGTFVPAGAGTLDGPTAIVFKEKKHHHGSSCSLAAAGTSSSALPFILLFAPILFVAVRRIARA